MIEVHLAEQTVEFEWTLDGQCISDWCMIREKRGLEGVKREYRSGAFGVHLSIQERTERIYLLSVAVAKGGEEFDLHRFKVRLRSPLARSASGVDASFALGGTVGTGESPVGGVWFPGQGHEIYGW